MDLGGGVGDAWEILANVGGNRGQPGSCALKRCRMSRRGTLGRALLVTGGVIDVHLGWPLLLEKLRMS
jgi:hypothetical protein